ncbi:MAG: HAMP domain-containing protein, partial [Spirulina sp.]
MLTISGISYWHLMSQLAHDTQAQLLGYITERGQREEAVFVLAQANHNLLRQEFLEQLANLDRRDGQIAFDRQFFQWSDHTVRNIPEDHQFDKFDTEHHPTAFVQPDVDLNGDFKTRLALSYDLVEQYGLGWQTNFLNTYISLPEGAVNVYIPGVDYGISAPTDYDIRAEEWAYLGDVAHNPERKTLWTGVYRDSVMGKWVVSAETPIDDQDGRHLGTIGHDIVLNDLIARVIDDHLEGTYNLLVRTDGQLIAAPSMMDIIQAEAGNLTVQTARDPSLQRAFSFAQQTVQPYSVLYNPDDRAYLAIAHLKGPDWYLITVYPEKLLQDQALSNTWFLLIVGLASLAVEVLLLFLVLRRQVATPLKSLLGATQQVTAGDFAVDLDVRRQDELGQLARAFTQMTHQLQGTFTDLEQKILEQQQAESLIVEKTRALEQALQERQQMQLQTLQNEKKMSALG